MLGEVNQNVVELEITVHHILFVQGLAPSYNLLKTTNGKLLWKASMQVQKVLHAAPIGELKDTVEVALRLDHLDLLDDIGTIDHLEEDKLSTQRKHPLLPVLRIAPARLVDPLVGRNLTRIVLLVHLEEPDGGLHALT